MLLFFEHVMHPFEMDMFVKRRVLDLENYMYLYTYTYTYEQIRTEFGSTLVAKDPLSWDTRRFEGLDNGMY